MFFRCCLRKNRIRICTQLANRAGEREREKILSRGRCRRQPISHFTRLSQRWIEWNTTVPTIHMCAQRSSQHLAVPKQKMNEQQQQRRRQPHQRNENRETETIFFLINVSMPLVRKYIEYLLIGFFFFFFFSAAAAAASCRLRLLVSCAVEHSVHLFVHS